MKHRLLTRAANSYENRIDELDYQLYLNRDARTEAEVTGNRNIDATQPLTWVVESVLKAINEQ